MLLRRAGRTRSRHVFIIVGVLLVASDARAQGGVGSGPLTSTLTDTEPTSGVFSIGPVKVAPGIVVREIGWDSNVFDESAEEGPKEDYVAAGTPDVAVFSQLRFVKVSAYAGAELTYYRKYESERSVGFAARGRVDLLLSRVRPFVGGGQTQTRTRPNGEIDVRANRTEEELSGGLAFELGPRSQVYASAFRTRTAFENAFEETLDLGQSLNREGYQYSAGVKTDLTPLTALTVYGGFSEDKFRGDSTRDTESRFISAKLQIGSEAVLTGAVDVSYRDMTAVDPLVKPYRGVTGSAALVYPFLEVGRLSLTASRSVEYSFDVADAYYVGNTLALATTYRLLGALDVEVRGGRSLFDYGFREGSPARADTLDTAGVGLGYNLPNRTRIAMNYEYSRRRSAELPDRNYERRRAYLSWTYAF